MLFKAKCLKRLRSNLLLFFYFGCRNFALLRRCCRFFFIFTQKGVRDHLPLTKSSFNICTDEIIKLLLIVESYFHLGRMHIDINAGRIKSQMQDCEGELVHHKILFVSLFQSLAHDLVFDISAVHKEYLKVPVGAVYGRFPEIPLKDHPALFCFKRYNAYRDVSSVYPVDDLF